MAGPQAPGDSSRVPSSRTEPIMSLVFLTEKLSGRKLNVAEVTQSEIGQKQKLQTVLEAVNELLRPHGWTIEWSVDCECHTDAKHHLTGALPWIFHCTATLEHGCSPLGYISDVIVVSDNILWFTASAIHSKNLVAIVYLLVALAMHFQAPIRLPEHVSVQVVVVKARQFLSVLSLYFYFVCQCEAQFQSRWGKNDEAFCFRLCRNERASCRRSLWRKSWPAPQSKSRSSMSRCSTFVFVLWNMSRCSTERHFGTLTCLFPVFFRMMMGRFGESKTHFPNSYAQVSSECSVSITNKKT